MSYLNNILIYPFIKLFLNKNLEYKQDKTVF